MENLKYFETIVLGAGAAGMMCAIHAGERVAVIDHAKAAGDKIRISGGGRCNFTNIYAGHGNFISSNPHFCKSALKRYTQWDFLDLVSKHGIPYHEKTLGQQFCDNSAKDIIKMLLDEMSAAGVELLLETDIHSISRQGEDFVVTTSSGVLRAPNLVVATGGKSIPKMGATGIGYKIAEQFGHSIVETKPGLVPLTFGDDLKEQFSSMAGISSDAQVQTSDTSFDEAVLFTHRGLSGPAILQISSYWNESTPIVVGFGNQSEIFDALRAKRQENGRRAIHNVMSEIIPKALATYFCDATGMAGNIADLSDKKLNELAQAVTHWTLVPTGTEGYRTAEVTLGGVDTGGLSSKTMESKNVEGLYFIGEVVDVTGWLGGYNFQWAWSSGWAAGTAIAKNSSHLKG